MTNHRGHYPRTPEYRARISRTAKIVRLHHDLTEGQIVDGLYLHEAPCVDCNTRVLPTMNERSEIRCSSCRAGHITDIIAARMGAG